MAFKILKKDMYVYAGDFYVFTKSSASDYINWWNSRVYLKKAGISNIESLLYFTLKEVFGYSMEYHLLYDNHVYPLKEGQGRLWISNRTYDIAEAASTAKEYNEYYDEEKNLGFLNTYNFYVYTKLNPYILYEKKNRKHYRFPGARIGIMVEKNGCIKWHEPVVIDKYSHPALPQCDAPSQRICNGSYDYNQLIERHCNEAHQIRAVLAKARQMMLRGYTGQSGSWHRLTEPMFRHMITNNINLEVTNT